MEWDLETVIKLSGQAASASAAGWLVWRKARLKLLAWRERAAAHDQMVAHFGSNPPAEIKKLITAISFAAAAMELKMNIVSERLGIGLYLCGTDARCTYVNPKLADMFGMSREDAIGWGWLSAIARHDQTRVREAWTLAVKELLPYSESYQLRNGSTVQTEAFPIPQHAAYVGYVVLLDKTVDVGL